MKIEDRTNKRDGKILQGMITNSTVLSRIASRMKDSELFFGSQWSNVIASWCLGHYERYRAAPGVCIGDYLNDWAERHDNPSLLRLLEKFLAQLSDDYEVIAEQINPDRLLDLADEHFEQTKLRRIAEEVKDNLDAGRLEQAQSIILNYTKVGLNAAAGIDLFTDRSEVESVFVRADESVLELEKDLGLFFHHRLERDGFLAFLAPEKSAKSFWLMEIAWRAMLQRKRVAFFQVGDLSRRQIEERLLIRAAEHPLYSPTGKWPLEINYPVSLRVQPGPGGQLIPRVEYEKRVYEKPLDVDKAWKVCERVMQTQVKSRNSYFKLSVHPTDSINVVGIQSILNYWSTQGFEADLVLCDYADILEDLPGKRDARDAINATWKKLRSLSLDQHVLVITATQSNADGYERRTLSRQNFSEDKRKLAHVTGMIGLNQTEEEKDKQLMRLNWIVKREGAYSTSKCLHVANCLALSQPVVLASF